MASDVVAGDPVEAPPRPAEPGPARRRLRPDRLAAAAVFGGLRQRAWSVLVLAAFVVLAAASAAGPMFAEASGNAAFQARRDAVPVTARQADAPVVRLSADVGRGSIDQDAVLAGLRTVPGLTEPQLTGGSVGAELLSGVYWESTAGLGDRRERGRLYAVEAPATELVPVGSPYRWRPSWVPARATGSS
jgi:putative ABC transport system permease protein